MTNPPPLRAPGGIAALGGRPVARIGFGAMQLAERPGRAATDRAAAVALLRRAVDLGVNHIDTAQFYGPGTCNELIRAALAPYPEELTLVTKVGATLRDSAIVAAQRPGELRAQVEANLATLGVEQVAVVNLRRLDASPGLRAEGDQLVDLDSQLAELISLRDAGKIGAIGLSQVDADRLRRALPAGIVCVQNAYSLLDRAAAPVLEVCRAHDIAWVPYFPLGSAFPGYPKVTDHPVVREIAARLDAAPVAVGLAWLLADYPHTLLIPGTSDPDHLAENMGAGAVRLAADDLAVLTGIGA